MISKRTAEIVTSLFYVTIVSCTISFSSRKSDDGSSSLKREDSLHIVKFDLLRLNQEYLYDSKGKMIFEEIDGQNIKDVLKENDFTWILLWASWCPHSDIDVPRAVKYYDKNLDGKRISQVLISQDYNIKAMNKVLLESNSHRQSYILSAAVYGTAEFEKVVKLKKEICTDCSLYKGTPQHILLDKNGKLIFFQAGELLRPDTILNLIGKY